MFFYLTRVADYHTTFDFVLVDTAKQQTNVVTSFTLIQ
jgi:predicted O-methyltransferase YrrM